MSDVRAAIALHAYESNSFAALVKFGEPTLDAPKAEQQRYDRLQREGANRLFKAAWAITRTKPTTISEFDLLMRHAARSGDRPGEFPIPDGWLEAIVKNLAGSDLNSIVIASSSCEAAA